MNTLSADAATRWQAPDLGPGASLRPGPSVAELEAIERAASDEGFRRGHAQGLANGEAEIRQLATRLQGLLEAFARPLEHFDAEVGAALGELAVQVAGVLVGQAYQADPALLAALVDEALRLAGAEARTAEVRLHPDDMATLSPLLTATDMPRARLTVDASLARGDVRVHTEALRIDGTLGARLQVALLTLGKTGAST